MLSCVSHAPEEVLSDNEWAGWLRWIKTVFDDGAIREYWERKIEPEKWFDPAFQDFIDNGLIKQSKIHLCNSDECRVSKMPNDLQDTLEASYLHL